MAKYKVKLISKERVADATLSVGFAKPKDFTYKAGQTIDLTIIDPAFTDTQGNTRTFSLASAPHEENLIVASRQRDSAFKRSLGALEVGAEMEIEGPFGTFTLPNKSNRSNVFIVGGIGVTPARSIVLDAIFHKLPHKIYLFSSNRRPEDAAFLEELSQVKNPNFTFIPTMTQMDKSVLPWTGEREYVDEKMLKKYLKDLSEPIYYLAGPTTMISLVKQTLNNLGIDDDDIHLEEFAGY